MIFKLREKNKSQISIFIILILILILLLLFLISSDSKDKTDNLNSEKKTYDSLSNKEINSIKTQVDYCLQRELKKALIVSGLRGGFIYDKGEEYIPGVIPSGSYDFKLISNLGLNYNNLKSKTLLYNKYELKIPLIDSNLKIANKTIYNHSIKEDFDTFLFNNFLKCVNKKIYEEKGFNISFGKYIGKPVIITNNKIIFEGLEAKKGDNVKIILDNNYYVGGVLNVFQNRTEVLFNSSISSNANLKESFGINLNHSIGINTTFNKENINAKLNFPFIIKNNLEIKKYEDITVRENIKFRQYLLLASLILNKKSMNKNLDINKTFLDNLIRDNNLDKVFEISKINILNTKLIDTPEEKLYVISIISKEDKVLGKPFVFNFGYYNKAPYLVRNVSGAVYDGERFMIYLAQNYQYNLSLLKFTKDDQFIDNYLSYFIPQHYDGADYYLDIDKKGNLKFKAKTKASINVEIKVTDGETVNSYDILFYSTLPDNTNNSRAKSCFYYKNSGNDDFPVASFFEDFVFEKQNNNYHDVYGFYLKRFDPSINFGPAPTIFFSKYCYFNESNYYLKAYISKDNGNTYSPVSVVYNPDKAFLNINPSYFSNPRLKIKVEVLDKITNSVITDPYILDLFGSKCLGPYSETDVNKINLLGGDMSCCNVENLISVAKTGNYNSIITSSSDSNIYSLNEKVLDLNGKFCYDFEKSGSFNLIDYGNEVIWQKTSLGNDITSSYEGKIVSICQGVYPTAKSNIIDISPSGATNVNLKLKGIYTDNFVNLESKNKRVKLTKVSGGGVCNFCKIPDNSKLTRIVAKDSSGKDLIFTVGTSVDVGTFADFGVFSIFDSNFDYVLADNNKYLTRNGGISWKKVSDDNGLGGTPSSVSISKGYCLPDDGNIGGIAGSPTYSYIGTDDYSKCRDIGYNGNKLIVPGPSSWICKVCPDNSIKKCSGSSFGCPSC